MELEKGQYYINGHGVENLCEKYDTPLYVYDGEQMLAQCQRLKYAFSGTNIRIKYACKALTNINILRLLRRADVGLDAVSIQEVRLGLQAGYKAEDILYTPNCVSFQEIKDAIELGVQINIDNISILEQFGHHFGSDVPCCIRINPHIVAGGNAHIQTGHIDSKFGISFHQLRHVLRIVDTYDIHVNGLHMHTGSDILDADVFLNGMEVLLESADHFDNLEFLDFGSGFKVAYQENDVITDVEALGEKVSERFNEFCQHYGKDLEIWFEPGKYIVSEAGYFLAQVNVVKQTTSTVFAGLDSGFNHFIRPMFYEGYHRIINVSHPTGTPRVYTVVGYICETDTFGRDRQLAEVREGDILAFYNAGAYCFEMSANYNSRFRPAEVLLYDGKDHLIRKRENMEDLQRNIVKADI